MHTRNLLPPFAAVVLASIGLGGKALWLDECYSLWRASLESDWWIAGRAIGWTTVIEKIALHDTHPPLYYLLLRVWRGMGGLVDEESWVRLPSLLFFVATVFLVQRMLGRYASERQALIGGFLTAGSCMILQFAQEARNYALAMLLATAATHFFVVGITRDRAGSGWKYGLTVLLGLYTYYYLGFLFLVHGIVIVILAFRETKHRTGARSWLHTQIVAATLFAPWAFWVLPLRFAELDASAGAMGGTRFSPSRLGGLASDFLLGAVDWSHKDAWAGLALGLVVVQWVRVRRSADREGAALFALILTSLLGPMLLLLLFPFQGHVSESKHLLFLLPLLWAAVALVTPVTGWARALPLLLIVGNLFSQTRYHAREKQDWREATSRVHRGLTAGDVVLFNPFYLRIPFFQYYRELDEQKAFTAGYTYPGRQPTDPSLVVEPRRVYAGPRDFVPVRGNNLWIVEVRGSPVSPGESAIHDWAGTYHDLVERVALPGLYGDVTLSYYRPR